MLHFGYLMINAVLTEHPFPRHFLSAVTQAVNLWVVGRSWSFLFSSSVVELFDLCLFPFKVWKACWCLGLDNLKGMVIKIYIYLYIETKRFHFSSLGVHLYHVCFVPRFIIIFLVKHLKINTFFKGVRGLIDI